MSIGRDQQLDIVFHDVIFLNKILSRVAIDYRYLNIKT